MYKQLKKMRQEEGFTLIELLIVIIILGVLAAIVVFSVSGVKDRGDLSACKADVNTIQTAAEAFYAAKTPPAYPTSMADLKAGGFIRQSVDPKEVVIAWSAGAPPVFTATAGEPGKVATPNGCSDVF